MRAIPFALALLLACCSRPPAKAPVDPSRAFYGNNCAECHGADGRGDTVNPGLRGMDAETLLAYMDGTEGGHTGGVFPDVTAQAAEDLAAFLAR